MSKESAHCHKLAADQEGAHGPSLQPEFKALAHTHPGRSCPESRESHQRTSAPAAKDEQLLKDSPRRGGDGVCRPGEGVEPR